jgi:glycosyltransferase involved in cell wall biosynthesis
MRIVCVVHDYPPDRMVGSARTSQQLCRRLAQRGHELHVVTSARPRSDGGAGDDFPVHRIGRGPRNGWARHVRYRLRHRLGEDDFGLARPLCGVIQRRIRDARPDLVLAIAASTQEVVAAAQVVRRSGVPGVVIPFYHVHAEDFVDDPVRWMKVIGSFDAVVTVTLEESAFLEARGIPPHRIEHAGMFVQAPEPIPVQELRQWRDAKGIGDRLLVVAGGSYSANKGAWTLARASLALPDVYFVLFGGDERARKRLEAEMPVGPNVEFAGFLGERDKSHLLHAADLLAMPSRGDAFGLLYIEANACGTPALAADLASMREVLGADGTFVPLDDPAALVAAIRSRSVRQWRLPEVAEGARKNAERFTRDAALERFAGLIERCTGFGRPADPARP